MSDKTQLPKSWKVVPLSVAAAINPPKGKIDASDSRLAHFVPMACVREEFGGIDVSNTRPLTEVLKGYTAFQEGDVLFAKITPCMENGKLAVVPPLVHQWGFGSTEFHVLRATEIALPKWIAHFISQATLRRDAQRSMTGSAGQLRVQAQWLLEQELPIPPLGEQERILFKIEELFSDLDAGVAALERAKANLKRYRAAVLKAAVEGKLTEEWRAMHPAKETASTLLARILKERRQKWETDQLAKFAAAGKEPHKNWREKYVEPQPPDTSGLPELPDGWCWASVVQLAAEERHSLAIGPFGSNLKVPDYRESGVPLVFVRNIRSGVFGGENCKYVTPAKATELDAHSVEAGDILITKMGEPPGDACLYPHGNPKAIITADCIKMRLHTVLPNAQLIVFAINSQTVRNQIVHITKGVAQQKVSLDRFSTIAIPLSPLDEQQQIVSEVEEKLSQIDATESQIEHGLIRASRLRQSILKQAFEGKLVPQDPNDEPASVLLESLRASQSDHDTKNKAKNNARPARRKKSERMVDK